MFCRNCGAINVEGARFCSSCGKPLGSPKANNKNHYGFAITSLILGGLSLIAWLVPICGVPLSIVGLVLGIAGKDSSEHGMAVAGIILCTIALVFGLANAAVGAYLGVTGQLYR